MIITKDDTTIVDGGGSSEDVKGRINQIKTEIENTDSDWDREKLQERLAKLAGGVAVIKVGAATEVELKEKKHRIEDAVSATRAAIEEGVVAGGGTALIRARPAVAKVVESLEGDEATGARTVWEALVAPARYIAENAGLEGSIWVQRIEAEEGATGPQREHRRAHRPDQGRHHRPGQGHPGGAAERGVDRRDGAHHRVPRGRQARAARRRRPRRRRRHGWHARHDVAHAFRHLGGICRSHLATNPAQMTVWNDSRPDGGAVSRDDRVLRPFWLHQAAEYLIGLVLVAQGLQSPTPVVPALAGGLVLVNAACVDGPLGAFRLCLAADPPDRRPRRHRRARRRSPRCRGSTSTTPAGSLMVVVAVVLGVVWWNSSFEPAGAPRTRRRSRSTAARRSAAVPAGSPATSAAPVATARSLATASAR